MVGKYSQLPRVRWESVHWVSTMWPEFYELFPPSGHMTSKAAVRISFRMRIRWKCWILSLSLDSTSSLTGELEQVWVCKFTNSLFIHSANNKHKLPENHGTAPTTDQWTNQSYSSLRKNETGTLQIHRYIICQRSVSTVAKIWRVQEVSHWIMNCWRHNVKNDNKT